MLAVPTCLRRGDCAELNRSSFARLDSRVGCPYMAKKILSRGIMKRSFVVALVGVLFFAICLTAAPEQHQQVWTNYVRIGATG